MIAGKDDDRSPKVGSLSFVSVRTNKLMSSSIYFFIFMYFLLFSIVLSICFDVTIP